MPPQIASGLAVCIHELAQRDRLTGRLIDQHVDGTRARLQQVLRQRPAQAFGTSDSQLSPSNELRRNVSSCRSSVDLLNRLLRLIVLGLQAKHLVEG